MNLYQKENELMNSTCFCHHNDNLSHHILDSDYELSRRAWALLQVDLRLVLRLDSSRHQQPPEAWLGTLPC